MLRHALSLLLVLPVLNADPSAQTTHQVDVLATTFAPANLTIDLGDTVLWDWVIGTHNVESGTVAMGFDGNFLSGPVTSDPQTTYSLTFDAAFLA